MENQLIKTIEKYMYERKQFDKRRAAIRKKNEELITYWKSIPWYRFWLRPSFEEQRDIILSNWSALKEL